LIKFIQRHTTTSEALARRVRRLAHSLHGSQTQSHSTYTHSVLTAIFPGEPGLAGCPP